MEYVSYKQTQNNRIAWRGIVHLLVAIRERICGKLGWRGCFSSPLFILTVA
jgi:hypothetical protein